jgi:threonine 3-dehydrogenase
MKAWIYTKKGEFNTLTLQDVPKPVCEADQVVLKIMGASVCGTDEQMFLGRVAGVEEGIIAGHEFFGEIVEIGPEANAVLAKRGMDPVSVGTITASESHYHVGDLEDEGIIGLWGPLDNNGKRLRPLNGAYAEFIAVPADCIYPITKELTEDFWPSLIEAAGNDALIGQYLGLQGAKTVGIVGCGPHGIYAQAFARHFGAEKIAAFEVDPYRLQFCRDLGTADTVFDSNDETLDEQVREFTSGKYFDAVVDIAGKFQAVLDMCIKYTRDDGILALFGLYGDPNIKIAGRKPDEIIFARDEFKLNVDGKNLNVVGITGRSDEIWKLLIDAVSKDKRLRDIIASPVKAMGPLNGLGKDTLNRDPKVFKRAYTAFE